MSIDPKYRFAISLIVTFAIGVSSGTLVLTNAIPAEYIKPVTAWCGILAFLGSSINTTISGLGMSSQSRIAAAASLPEVQKIVAAKSVADAAPSDKVVPQ